MFFGFLKKSSLENFIFCAVTDIQIGSKYASGISFISEFKRTSLRCYFPGKKTCSRTLSDDCYAET